MRGQCGHREEGHREEGIGWTQGEEMHLAPCIGIQASSKKLCLFHHHEAGERARAGREDQSSI